MHYKVNPLLLWKCPWPAMSGQQITLKIGSYSGCQNVSQGLGFLFKFLLYSLVCILPLIFSILLLLAIFHEYLVSRNLPCFNFTRILTIEIHPIMCFKANLNNSSSIPSCELPRHLTQIMASAGKNRNLLNANQLLPKSLFHLCKIFKCKFEDQIGKNSLLSLITN